MRRRFHRDAPSDFSKHIRALGDLLALTNDRAAALELVRQYQSLHVDSQTAKTQQPEDEADSETIPGNPFKVTPPNPA